MVCVVSDHNGIGKKGKRFCDKYGELLRQGQIKMNQSPYALHPINEECRGVTTTFCCREK